MIDEKYEEWKKTRKEFYPDCPTIIAKEVGMAVRVGDYSIKLGDYMGGSKVIRIEAYGKELKETGAGLTCWLTFDSMPRYTVVESYKE